MIKSYTLLIGVLLFVCSCVQQNEHTCCEDPVNEANASFVAFSEDPEFLDAHPAPLEADIDHGGKIIEFPVKDGKPGRAFLMKSHGNSSQYLILLHEWWGLNDYIKRETSMWCHQLGINVLALDLYDGKVASTADEASKLMQACKPERASAIIEGAKAYLGAGVEVRTMGWCFGGGWSLKTALAMGDQTKACVMYYGMPVDDVDALKELKSDVLFIHASKDKWITDDVVSEFEKNMKEAGKDLTVHRYDADHAFANPSSPRYQQESAVKARSVVKSYLSGK